MAYAILRTQKLKSYSQIAAMGEHWFRLRFTANADYEKSHLNKMLIPCTSTCEAVTRIIKDNNILKVRSNAVLAIEIVMTFSPDYLRNQNDTYKENAKGLLTNWIRASFAWLKETYGDRCGAAILHLDEKTPHIHCLVVPVETKITKSGKLRTNLNARGILGGKHKLSALQDDYHRAVEHLGLSRGVKGSIATHQEVKNFYGALKFANQQSKLHNIIAPGETPEDLHFWQIKLGQMFERLSNKDADEKMKAAALIEHLVEVNKKLKFKLSNNQNTIKRWPSN